MATKKENKSLNNEPLASSKPTPSKSIKKEEAIPTKNDISPQLPGFFQKYGPLVILIGVFLLFLTVLSQTVFKGDVGGSGVAEQLSLYHSRIQKYPEDPENYKMLSTLYEKKKDFKKAEQYYDLYKQIEKNLENKRDRKSKEELAALLQKANQLSANNNGSSISSKEESKQLSQAEIEKKVAEQKEKERELKEREEQKSMAAAKSEAEKKAVTEYKKGVAFYEKRDFVNAETSFKKALDYNSDLAPANALLANTLLNKPTRELESVRKFAKKAIEIDPTIDSAYYAMGEVFRETDSYANAETQYLKAVELNPENYMAFYRLASLKYRQQAYVEAADLFKKVLRIRPDYYRAKINLAVSEMALDEILRARANLRGVLESKEIFSDQDSLYQVYSKLGQCEINLKDYGKALESLQKAVSIKKRTSDFFNLGIVYEERKNQKEAINAYLTALSLDDKNESASYNLGLLYYNTQDYKNALIYLTKTLQINPRNISAWVQLGKTYSAEKQDDNAKSSFERALKINEKHPTANIEIAKYWKEKGIMEKAVPHAKTALANATSDEEKVICYNELGLIYTRFKLYPEASTAFQGARDINPSSVNTLLNLARLEAERENFEKAIEVYETILKIDPKQSDVYEFIANIYIKLGKSAPALGSLEEMMRRFPNHPRKVEITEKISKLK